MAKVGKILALSLPLAVFGCAAVGPDYQAPQPPTVTAQALQIDSAEGIQVETGARDWWSQFQDPTLNQLVQAALSNNKTLAAAAANVDRAQAVLADVANDDLPKGTLDAAYLYENEPDLTGLRERTKGDVYRLGLQPSWELDLFGRVRRASEAAQAEAEVAQAEWRSVQIGVVSAVARVYGSLRATQGLIEVAQKNLQALEQTLGVAQTRTQAGASTEFDEARVRADIAAIAADIPALRARAESLTNQLAVLTGQEPAQLNASMSLAPLPKAAIALSMADPAELFRQRADIQRAERGLAAQTARIGVATADLFPQVSISGFVGFLAGTGSDLAEADSRAISLGPTIAWNLLDRGSVKARMQVAEANAKIALARYEETVLQALASTRTAFVTHRQSQLAERQRSEQLTQSSRARAIADRQYREGLIDLLALLDTERSVYAAEAAWIQASAEVYLGVVDIYDALGGGQLAAVSQRN